jgi:hypothetical protein
VRGQGPFANVHVAEKRCSETDQRSDLAGKMFRFTFASCPSRGHSPNFKLEFWLAMVSFAYVGQRHEANVLPGNANLHVVYYDY